MRGTFSKNFRKDGIKTEGIEFNEKTWKLREVSSIKLGNFESYINKKNYDLISINQTIYYFDDPIQILKNAKMLTPDGHIMIVTTNMNSKFRKENKIWTQGCKICLSESNFKNFSFIGLDLIKIQNFDDKIYRDYYLSKKV